jgi:hypothetical protein
VRTNQTTLCPRCALRFWPTSRCPRCKKLGVIDLRDPAARKRCADGIHREPWWYRAMPVSGLAYGITVLLCGPAAGLAIGLSLEGLVGADLATLLGLGTGGATWALAHEAWKRLDFREAQSRPVRPFGSPPLSPHASRAALSGVVRIGSAVPSALTRTPCAVFRLRAVASGTELDDGGGADFALELEGGERVTVEIDGGATVDLTTVWVDVDASALAPGSLRYLAERGLELGAVPTAWEEAVLCDGDRAEVHGTIEQRPVPEGYRGSRTTRVLRETAGSPLVIRRATGP